MVSKGETQLVSGNRRRSILSECTVSAQSLGILKVESWRLPRLIEENTLTILAFVLLLPVLSCVYRHPSDAAMENHLKSHRGEFEELVKMMVDADLEYIERMRPM